MAKDVKAGRASDASLQAMAFMEANPGAVLGVLDLIEGAANRKKPNQAMLGAYDLMFTSGLELLRYQTDRGHDWAVELLDAARELLHLLGEGGALPPDLLMSLVNAFIEAKLDPGDDLTELLGEIARETVKDEPAPTLEEIGELFESMVAETGGNEFEIHAGLTEVSQALPPEFRRAILLQLAASGNPALRDAAGLCLLDPAPEVRRAFCLVIAEGGSVSPVALRRMIAVRNWLPESEHELLDAVIRKARKKPVDCASWPKREVQKLLATNIDGAGAQSVFAVVGEGRKFHIACLLVKRGVGIADAWCLREQSKADVKSFVGSIQSQIYAIPVDMGFIQDLVAHHLSLGRSAGNVPAPGFLEFIEALGIESWQPSALSAGDLVARLEMGLDDAPLGRDATDEIIRKSGGWLDEMGFMETWFEDDAEVAEVLSGKSRSGTAARIDAAIQSILEPRRAKWADCFLWTAFWLKQSQDQPSPWLELFVAGRELHRGRPIADFPVMRSMAEVIVEVLEAQR